MKNAILQGSVLGPAVVVIFINDLPDIVDSLDKIFADDSAINTANTKALHKDLDKWAYLPINQPTYLQYP